ncbi:delta-endotoxin CytB [Ganoderma leucocontextum]|nr:delta-endotoxin CytB [Ganoderma leucocontextum]
MKLSNAYVLFDEAQGIAGLNWDAFKDTVVAHPQPGLAFVKLESTSIANHTGSVADMAGRIAQFLYDTFSLQGTNTEGLRAQIHAAFKDVGKAESSGWFSSSTYEAHGSSWEYRIVFALQDPDRPDSFYTVVSTIKLTADIYDHKGWFGIGNETRHNFSADITGMELVVNRSYASSA